MFKPGMGNLFVIRGRINCGISLAGRKNQLISSQNYTLILQRKIKRENYCLLVRLSWSFVSRRCCVLTWVTKILMRAILN